MTTAESPAKPASTQADDIRSVAFVSLGCPKNLVDSEKMLGLLASDGLEIVSTNADSAGFNADAVVVNTCGFLEASKEESLSVIAEAAREKQAGRLKRLVVAGCLVQRHRAKLLDWAPHIDAMIGVFDRDRIVHAVRGAPPKRDSLTAASDQPKYWIAANALSAAKDRGLPVTGLTVNGKDGKGIGYFEDDSARLRLTPRHYAYLRVSEGCNQNCAFCTIPSIRGKMRSKPLDAIQREAVELIRDGAFELNLIGQDTTSYGDDIGLGLAADGSSGGLPALLRTVNDAFDLAGLPHGWVRLMYAYPTNFSDRMIDALASLSILNSKPGRIVPYIDIPLQHASNRILAAMRRNVTAELQRDLMLKLRERVPGIAIRTTFITGFPGETEDDHEQLLEFIEEVGFDALGVFQYSPEDSTPAGAMEADPALRIDPETKQRRHDEIMALQQSLAFEQAEFLASQFDESDPESSGVRLNILIDRPATAVAAATTGVTAAARLYEGRTYFQAPTIDAVTYVHSSRPLSPGELVPCVIVGSDNYDLIARPADELSRARSLPILAR